MGVADEAVVRRFYEELCHDRKRGISVHRMEDGKIAETWQVWDTLGFLPQLGVIPAA